MPAPTLYIVIIVLIVGIIIQFIGGLISKISQWIIRYSKRRVPANFLFTHIEQTVKNNIEIYIIVANEEYLLNSKDVHADISYVFYINQPINGRIKWDDSSNKNGEISIPRRNRRLLHFATVDTENSRLYVHLMNGDDNLPKCKEGFGPYGFPLNIQGSIYLWKKFPKVVLNVGITVVVDYKGKDDVSVKIERKY